MSIFRSLDMSYIQVILPTPVAEEFADSVGREGVIQFTDLNEDVQPFQRPYTKDIIRIQEIERRIKDIEGQLKEYKVTFDSQITPSDLVIHRRQSSVDVIQKDVYKSFQELRTQGSAEKDLKKQWTERQAKVEVLSQMDGFLSQERRAFVEERLGDGQKGGGDEIAFKFIAGVVTAAQRVSFERQVYLTSRGNSLIRFQESNNDTMVFAVFFLGSQLQRSLRRLCQFMNIQICYESDSEIPREVLLEQAKNERTEDKRAHSATRNLLMQLLREVAEKLKDWKLTLAQEQGIRITMNRFRSHQGNSVLRAEGWCASNQKERIQQILEGVVQDKGVGQAVMTEVSPKHQRPPTYFETNELTAAFQQIVDTYGVPRYKEFNPAIPTVITFPFLFGVMYGDVFHGSCLLLFALSLFVIAKITDINKTPLAPLYFARYVLLLMGMFGTYCGMIYNDCLAIMINGWNKTQWQHGESEGGREVMIQRDVYAVGLDPAWSGVNNQLAFANSLKMKLSVIIGVTQMTFGLFLKLSNHLHEQDYLSVFFEFVPQLVFMLCFFGYMVFLILYKWCIDWSTSKLPDTPSLITVLIKMFLSPGTVDTEVQIFPSSQAQAQLQTAFLLLLMFSIPVMLCVKPLVLRHRMKHSASSHELLMDEEQPSAELQMASAKEVGEEVRNEPSHDEFGTQAHDSQPQAQGHGHEHESFGDIMIHQLIHTIEYVLGTISNTASYLRLWALSLAHAQLSEVFFDKTLRSTLTTPGGMGVVMNVASVFMFIMFTLGVLLVMDVLECFLHALRLHWVEFQNKFYYGDGRAFEPFSFGKLLDKKEKS